MVKDAMESIYRPHCRVFTCTVILVYLLRGMIFNIAVHLFTKEGEEGGSLSGCKSSETMLSYVSNQDHVPSLSTSNLIHSIRSGLQGVFLSIGMSEKRETRNKSHLVHHKKKKKRV